MAKTATPETTNCRRCHALLTDPRRVAKGIGRTCERKERQEQAVKAAGFKAAAVEKAHQLIADGAIIPVRGKRVFAVVSSNGIDRYLTAPETCNCPAGLKARHPCYHRAAATILAA